MLLNKFFKSIQDEASKLDDHNGSVNNQDYVQVENNQHEFEEDLDPELEIELEQLKLSYLKLQEQQIQCKQRMLLLNIAGSRPHPQRSPGNRCILPDGRIVVRNHNNNERAVDLPNNISAAGDSRALYSCSCDQRAWKESGTSGSSKASTCVLCSEDRSVTEPKNKDKSPLTYDNTPKKDEKSISTVTRAVDISKIEKSEYSRYSKTTEVTKSIMSKSDYSKISETVTKQSDVTSKRVARLLKKSDMTCDFKYTDFYSDSDDEADETNRLILLRNADYMDIVDDHLKVVVALSGYPKSKMRLKQMEQFQHSLNSVIEMQLKAGLMKKSPSFLDYYINRGAIVCICKDKETRDWIVRVTPGLQERMSNNLILLKAKVKRLCLAVIKIPKSCWPATAHDAFKLLQYFNPTLKTNLWKIYAQKSVDDVETTSFLVDRTSGEIIRGPNFKNVIDYNQMEFELTGYTEIYYECFLSDMDEDLSSVASRVKLLEELRSNEVTPRNKPDDFKDIGVNVLNLEKGTSTVNVTENYEEVVSQNARNEDETTECKDYTKVSVLERSHSSVSCEEETDNLVTWHADDKISECEKVDCNVSEVELNEASISAVAVSDKTDSVIESSENLGINRNSNLNIDTNRGIAYHRRTNYLHVENELKMAIVLEGYPHNKLEGTHIRRLKHLFKEYLHKDMKMQRFANLIIPKFQDVYLSNGAVIYICDSLETKDYLIEILPKFITSTSLKLTFRDIKHLVRYTRIVMRLPKELAHVESRDLLYYFQEKYPKLKPDCWKYYSDVAGKQKRQFGVDPESLDVIRSSDFDPVYEGEKLCFRIIDRQKPDVNFEESNVVEINNETALTKILKEKILKTMYCAIEPNIMNAPLTKIRTNHYSDLIADDLKLYVGPTNYPETRIDEGMFYSIKKTVENIVFESIETECDEFIPKFHDLYLFDGVIFVICQDMRSRLWIEKNIATMNAKLKPNLKATEFRGAVGIISMVVKTTKDTDEVVSILQNQNPRLRTKYWRKISSVKSRVKLDVVLQIDKLSAQVIKNPDFNGRIGDSIAVFNLGHLQSLLKPKLSLEELTKKYARQYHLNKTSLKKEPNRTLQNECPNAATPKTQIEEHSDKLIHNEELKLASGESKVFFYSESEAKSGDSLKSYDTEENIQGLCKMTLMVPTNILPDLKADGLEIILDLLEDKNPGLNTELWKVLKRSQYSKGKFCLIVDKQSASVIKGKHFDPTLGGERLRFIF